MGLGRCGEGVGLGLRIRIGEIVAEGREGRKGPFTGRGSVARRLSLRARVEQANRRTGEVRGPRLSEALRLESGMIGKIVTRRDVEEVPFSWRFPHPHHLELCYAIISPTSKYSTFSKPCLSNSSFIRSVQSMRPGCSCTRNNSTPLGRSLRCTKMPFPASRGT